MGLKDDANELKGILGELNRVLEDSKSAGSGIADGLNSSKTAMEDLLSAAQEYSKSQLSEKKWYETRDKLSKEELKTLSDKLQLNKEALSASNKVLSSQMAANKKRKQSQQDLIKNLKSQKELSIGEKIVMQEAIAANKRIKSELLEQSIQHERNNVLLKDQDKSLEDVEKSMKKASQSANFKDGMGKVGGELDKIQTPLSGMLNPLKLINDIFTMIFGNAQKFDTEIGNSAKSLNISYQEAANVKKEMMDAADASGDLLVNSESLNRNVLELNKNLGTSVSYSDMSQPLKNDVELMSKLQNSAGYTAEETAGIAKYTMATGKEMGKSLNDFAKGFKMQGLKSKLVLNEKEAMKEIGKLSKSIQISIKGGAEGLGESMAAAKALGTDLGKVDDIAGSLLNFEESIANELEAELLTGKDLNLEKARQAAMDNNLAVLAKEIKNEVGSAAEFGDMNRIQQEAIAKAMGMSREEMSSMLMEQEALAAMNMESAEAAQAEFDRLVEKHGIEGAMAEMGENALTTQMEQAAVQEKAVLGQAKMADKMTELVDMLKFANKNFNDMFKKIMEIFDKLGGVKTLLVVIGGIIVGKMVKGLGDFIGGAKSAVKWIGKMASKEERGAIASIVKGAWSSLGTIPVAGPVLAAGAIGVGLGALATYLATADDMFSPGGSGGGYGNRTLMGPEGAIALNNKDDIIAGTDLFKGNDVSSEGGGATKMGGKGTMSVGSDMSSVVAAINTLGAKVEAMSNRPINVGMDGKKVVEASTGDNPNTFGEEVGKNSFALQ